MSSYTVAAGKWATDGVAPVITAECVIAAFEEYTLLLAGDLGILKDPTPKQMGVVFYVDTADQEITAQEVRELGDGALRISDQLSADEVELVATVEGDDGPQELRYGALKISRDVAMFLSQTHAMGAAKLHVVGPSKKGFVLVYSERFPLRDWLYGVVTVSPAGYMWVPPIPEYLEELGVLS